LWVAAVSKSDDGCGGGGGGDRAVCAEREKAGREKRVMQYWWKMRGERVRCGLEEAVRCVYE
jgi:hypothetical protein